MDYNKFDNEDSGTSDADYFAFVDYLSEQTARELKAAGTSREEQRKALCRYWARGYRASLTPSELIDFLGVDTPSILDMCDYSEEEADAVMALSDSLTEDEIKNVALF